MVDAFRSTPTPLGYHSAKAGAADCAILDEIAQGEVIYEDETKLWLAYAQDNLASALVLLESDLFNPYL